MQTTPTHRTRYGSSILERRSCTEEAFGPDINEWIGITSTPVVDPVSRTIYCVAKTKEGGSYFHRLHALDIGTGLEKLGGPVVLGGSVPGNGIDNVGGVVSFGALLGN